MSFILPGLPCADVRRFGVEWIVRRWAASFLFPIALAVPAFADRAPSALARSRPVAQIAAWYGRRFMTGIGRPGLWLDAHRVLHTVHRGGSRTAHLLDIRTGKDVPLPDLTRHLDWLNPEIADSEALSPDGRRLIWSERWGRCMVCAVRSGARASTREDADGSYRDVHWLPDSRRWLEVFRMNGQTRSALLHDAARPGWAQPVAVGERGALLASVRCIVASADALALEAPERDLGISDARGRVTLWRFPLLKPGPMKRVGSAPAPRGATDWQCALSPDGAQLAWEVWIPAGRNRLRGEIWVSVWDGRAPRLVGVLPIRRQEPFGGAVADIQLQWVPGGRALSFVWKDRLRLLPL